ncbi:efflux RND transporter periplasmic adaptor subunit [Pseudomonas aeruginosa]|jgi:membrane fusion protein, multidrug efflux system|nr:efflux RND transporter periplasmic adaptor subunit [Pseudomonas aeruginosa]MCS9139080.1 efflux RND transporter periplasmic adaptor subunit [Pseudomonas aeruginosa]MCS9211939.1 efflux RND transporter periplasmic adaptor subunit [Pseudomonas aeruginosa]
MNIKTMQGFGALLSVALLLSACEKTEQAMVAGPPEVGVVELKARDVVLTSDLPGRTAAYRVAEVRPQVSGIIQKRLFTEGTVVRKGQQLYQIDPSLYQAAVDKAEASRDTARNLAQRYQRLLDTKAISRQQFDDAQATWKQAEAELKTARINLEYTHVMAPIDGRISRSNVTEGALVSAQQSLELASINQLDPIYVDVTQASTEVLRLRRELVAGHLAMVGPDQVKVDLTLEDGTPYAQQGVLKFSEVTVDPSTGAVTLRAQFPNPDGLLMPGMFVHGTLVEGVRQQAVLAPQQGVSRDLKGEATAWVVAEGDKAELRHIKASRTVGNQWLVESGLKPGDRVVTEGVQRLRPGIALKPVAAGNVAPVQSIVSAK